MVSIDRTSSKKNIQLRHSKNKTLLRTISGKGRKAENKAQRLARQICNRNLGKKHCGTKSRF